MRVLRNLHGVYSDGEDWERATRSADRLLKLSPNDPDALPDRGLGYLHMGHASGPRTDLAPYLQLNPTARDALTVRARLAVLGGPGPARRATRPASATPARVNPNGRESRRDSGRQTRSDSGALMHQQHKAQHI